MAVLRRKGKQSNNKKSKKKARAPRERKGLTFGFLMLVLFILAGTGVFVVAMHQSVVSRDLAERRCEQQIAAEQEKQESLRLELARLKSPDRVARIAADELGLQDPVAVIYLKYSLDGSGKIACQSTMERTSQEPTKETGKKQASVKEENSGNLTQR